MKNRNLIIIAFILVALLQLYVPASMVYEREDIMASGKEFRFRTAPVDPNDPFRGKYISLQYQENNIEVKNASDWTDNETVYVIIAAGKDGYAGIQSVSKEEPSGKQDYVKAKVEYVTNDRPFNLFIRYPFDIFYMEESKAPVAEKVYRQTTLDTNQVAYGLVIVKNGEAVIKDVVIDGTSISKVAKEQKARKK
jgi:uncharacterized membrane-anchored protein